MNVRSMQFFGLNGIRALSLISLILVFTSTILLMVNNIKAVNHFEANKGLDNSTNLECDYIEGSTVPHQPAGVFFAIVGSLLVIFQSIILFMSECCWPLSFFDRYFPVLGSEFGLGALGIFQCLISTQILSHHVDDFTLVSAYFLLALGCINMLLGLIFREDAKPKRSIRRWRSDSKDLLPTHGAAANGHAILVSGPSSASVYSTEKVPQYYPAPMARHDSFGSTDKASLGFGRQAEKAAHLRGFILQQPGEALPRNLPPSQARAARSVRTHSAASDSSSMYDGTQEPHGRSASPTFKSSTTAV